jgi:hypothetical protein
LSLAFRSDAVMQLIKHHFKDKADMLCDPYACEIASACCSNAALMQLKLQHWDRAVAFCDAALECGAKEDKDRAKIMFRRGQGLLGNEEPRKAYDQVGGPCAPSASVRCAV